MDMPYILQELGLNDFDCIMITRVNTCVSMQSKSEPIQKRGVFVGRGEKMVGGRGVKKKMMMKKKNMYYLINCCVMKASPEW